MSTFINDNLFVVLLIFGGVLVCTRGHELYSTPSPKNDAQWLLTEMQLSHLTGNRKFATGFVFYMMPVLFFYLLLSVSPEILSLSMGITGTTTSVGALTLTGSDVHTFAPLLAATAVVTLLNVKPFSSFEHAVRRISHSVAGIPQHIQDIVRQIRRLDFRSMPANTPLSVMRLDHVKGIPGLESDLAAIGKLDDWIFGDTGMLVWSDKANQVAQYARQRAQIDYDALKRRLISQHSTTEDSSINNQALTDESLEEIVRLSRELRIQLTRLLAVLIANQDEQLPENIASMSLWNLISRAQRKRSSSRHINILATSTLVGIVISVPLVTLFNFIVILAHDLSIGNAAIDFSRNTLYLAGKLPSEFYWLSLNYSASAAWWDVLGIGLVFFTGCAASLIYRASRVNAAQWELWHARRQPVFQYLTIALLACVSAGFFYELFLFVKLVIWPSAQVRNAAHFASMLKDFGGDYVAFGLFALVAMPGAVLVCRVSDDFGSTSEYPSLWRDPWLLKLCWSVGLVSMALYFFVRALLGEIHALSDAILALVVPGITLFIMSAAYWRIGESRPRTVLPGKKTNEHSEPHRETRNVPGKQAVTDMSRKTVLS